MSAHALLGPSWPCDLESKSIDYYNNGVRVRISTQTPVFPLFADISMHDTGAHVSGLEWIGSADALPGEAVQWTSISKGLHSAAPGDIKKESGSAAWEYGAVSSASISSSSGPVLGVRAFVQSKGASFMIGLTHESSSNNLIASRIPPGPGARG